jgi:hypothetical protein
VVDLGCGDFRVGRLLGEARNLQYIGVDVVSDLISYNQSQFGREGVEVAVCGPIMDKLRPPTVCTERQFPDRSRIRNRFETFAYRQPTEGIAIELAPSLIIGILRVPQRNLYSRDVVPNGLS